jgi:hypothetical protein
MGMLTDSVQVVIGVDTHKHTHTAAVVASTGAHLAERTVAADPAGYRMLLEAAAAFPGGTVVGDRRHRRLPSTCGRGMNGAARFRLFGASIRPSGLARRRRPG